MTRDHLAFVRSLDCCIEGCRGSPVQAHHVRTAATAGVGLKPPDTATVPLCHGHHRELHDRGRRTFEARYGVDLGALAAFFAIAGPEPG